MNKLDVEKFYNTISLVKINEYEIRPMMIMKKSKREVAVFRIIPYKSSIKDSIYIGKKYGLKFEAAILTSKAYKVEIDKIIKVLSTNQNTLNKKELNQALSKYNKICKYEQPSKLVSIKDLHKELKVIKRKIEICKFNNEDYSKLQIRVDDIVEELGFATPINKYNYNRFNGYRVAPSKGYIKIYGIN